MWQGAEAARPEPACVVTKSQTGVNYGGKECNPVPLTHEYLISMMDRRFALLDGFDRREYLVQLISFADFLFNDPEVSPYSQQLIEDYSARLGAYERLLEEAVPAIIDFRDRLAAAYPNADDSAAEPPTDVLDSGRRYEWTLAHFDDLVRGESRLKGERINTSPSHYDDNTLPGQLIRILKSKANSILDEEERCEKALVAAGKEPEPIPEALSTMWAEFRTIEDGHRHSFRYFVNHRRAAPGHALIDLREVVRRLNKEPEEFKTLRDTLANFQDALYWSFLEEVLYRDDSDLERLDRDVQVIRKRSRVAYEGVRETIGKLGARIQIVHRYKTRCMWYDGPSMRTIAEQGELPLTRHLALFLFDQGLPVTTRQRLGVHELDVADIVQGSVAIEVKVYNDRQRPGDIKKRVLRGLAQLHAYMNGLDAALKINEGFLVVFRAGGRLLDMPRAVNTPRFSLIPVLIDVGEAIQSGSRQPAPLVIEPDKIQALLTAE